MHKNTATLAGILSRMKLQRGGLDALHSPVDRFLEGVDSSFRLLGLMATIVCVSASTNMFFPYVILGLFLAALALKAGDSIVDILKPALAACFFTAIIMLPAILIGQPSSFVRIALKVFISVGLVISLSRGMAYNRLIAGLRAYRVPGLFIFILDIALKYIVLLGDVALGVLESLRLRSVGKNPDKRGSSAGIIGVTFLKAHDYAGGMYEAMECRGFTGDYVVPSHKRANLAGVLYLILIIVEVCGFLYLEGFLG